MFEIILYKLGILTIVTAGIVCFQDYLEDQKIKKCIAKHNALREETERGAE